MMTSTPVERDGPAPYLTMHPRRRTVADYPLRAPADHVDLTRRRQYARRFTALAGGVDPYPDPRSSRDDEVEP